MSNISMGEIIALIKSLGGGGGGGGTSNYNSLSNRPKVNGTTLSGNQTGADYGLLDTPSTAGTAGQVLTSDGQGGQAWATVIDDTAGASDANKTWSADKLTSTVGDIETLLAAI